MAINGTDLKDFFVFHIPHSSLNIPDYTGYLLSKSEIHKENIKLSDLGTDEIFNFNNTSKIITNEKTFIFPYSRLYCDVERLPDDLEQMFKQGRGFYYTKTDDGRELRDLTNKENVSNLFTEYHENFKRVVLEKVKNIGTCTIIDCHSFSERPFETDIDFGSGLTRPDFCLGTNSHTPRWLVSGIYNKLKTKGYTVTENFPYTSSIVPLSEFEKNKGINSIMIEVNRKLFICKKGLPIKSKVKKLNILMKSILDF